MMRTLVSVIVLYAAISYGLSAQGEGFYEVSRLPFSSNGYDEFAPAFYRQGLVYTSNRPRGYLVSRMTSEGENLFNIYFSDQSAPGKWRSPGIFSKNLVSNYHDGPVSFTADGNRIFFTRNIPGSRNEPSRLGIFMADYLSGEWVNIAAFPHNNTSYNLAHPSISEDGNILYFTSDKPGGHGGMDLYVSRFNGREWSAPENLGVPVNTPGDEVFPHIHPGGRLYFSSDYGSNGDLDLFFSHEVESRWQKPVRLPEPLNSKSDDFGFIAGRDLRTGYFSSNREGTDNIYSFLSTFPVFPGCDSIRLPALCYIFFEERAAEIDTSLVYFEWDMGDGTRIRGLEADHCFNGVGTYNVRLDVIDRLTGESQYNVAWYPFRIDKVSQPHIASADTIYAGKVLTLDASDTYLAEFDPRGYYWESGDGAQYEGQIVSHSYTEPGVYRVALGVTGDMSLPVRQKACAYKYVIVIENHR
jgi:hypothetical protein